jgi:hypothetical protein
MIGSGTAAKKPPSKWANTSPTKVDRIPRRHQRIKSITDFDESQSVLQDVELTEG